ncbi:MAG: aspartate carbamoyltransferase regulatory subunit [Clostridia bacterium]|nr:aspartate carbamoyltransferase regulatory subunit [Clostridia bacterium]
MKIDAIKNGIVIDHIEAGCGMQIYQMLGMDKLSCPVALLRNVPSKKLGHKDIIKVDGELDIDLDILGYFSPNVTVNFIRDGKLVDKRHIDLPTRITDLLRCKNPRCITTTEQDIHHIFRLADPEKRTYRCIYCDAKAD